MSILIPTCDHIRDLETCVESIYARTTYPDFEIILIENNSKAPETFRTYKRMQKEHPDNLKVVTWEGKGFNYSALNNFGEKFATGEYLLLLNNDTEVITAAWLEEMVMYAQQKRVGCVGAKLLYPDDTIQHAGVGFGIGGVAGHLHKYYPASSDGYMGRLNYVQDVYADTAAACSSARRSTTKWAVWTRAMPWPSTMWTSASASVRQATPTYSLRLPSSTTTRARAAAWRTTPKSRSVFRARCCVFRPAGAICWLRATLH